MFCNLEQYFLWFVQKNVLSRASTRHLWQPKHQQSRWIHGAWRSAPRPHNVFKNCDFRIGHENRSWIHPGSFSSELVDWKCPSSGSGMSSWREAGFSNPSRTVQTQPPSRPSQFHPACLGSQFSNWFGQSCAHPTLAQAVHYSSLHDPCRVRCPVTFRVFKNSNVLQNLVSTSDKKRLTNTICKRLSRSRFYFPQFETLRRADSKTGAARNPFKVTLWINLICAKCTKIRDRYFSHGLRYLRVNFPTRSCQSSSAFAALFKPELSWRKQWRMPRPELEDPHSA